MYFDIEVLDLSVLPISSDLLLIVLGLQINLLAWQIEAYLASTLAFSKIA